MPNKRQSVSEVDGFIDMLRAACEDHSLNKMLEKILLQPDAKRKEVILLLVEDLTNKDAPSSLIEAISCLIDDGIAERAYQVLYQCSK